MTPGGVNEIIAHFIGYWHLAEDIARARLLYETTYEDVQIEYAPLPLRDERLAGLADELTSSGARVPLLDGAPVFRVEPLPTIDLPRIPAALDGAVLGAPRLPPPPFGFGGGKPGGGGGQMPPGDAPDPKITVTYETGADQRLFIFTQQKMLADSDQLLVSSDAGVGNLHTIDVVETLKSMLDEAAAQVPAELNVLTSGVSQEVIDFITARSTAQAAAPPEPQAGEGQPPEEVQFNRVYQNDAVLSEDAQHPSIEFPPPHEVELPRTDGTVAGLSAELGSNTQFSSAKIIDANEETMTLIVLGNYHQTDAIFQTNVYKDLDQVDVAGVGTVNDLVTGENRADNIAEFIRDDLFSNMQVGAIFAGLEWHVDVLDGDFLDIKTFIQENWIIDNDVTTQTTSGAYERVLAGGSQQISLASLVDLGRYELIIVGGDFHTANFIFQRNILLDDDILKIAADLGENDADRSSQSVSWGGNTLVNDATIARLGSDSFGSIDDGLRQLIDAIGRGDTELASSFGRLINGDGSGTFDILYITGSYFDINVISQTNVLVDLDTAIQLLPDIMAPRGGDRLEQSASTGGNTLTNTATITDVGALSDQYLGGQFYQDAMLVQSNIVVGADEVDDVTLNDTETLVSEVIAFINPSQEAAEETLLTRPSSPSDDFMGGALT